MRVRTIAGVFSVLLLLAATGCGHVPERNHHSVARVQTSAQDSVTLPDGYGPITTLAGDPNGSGVWFWADTKTTLSIFHVDGHGKLTSWPVLTGADNVGQAISGLTVTLAGIVWLGINATLTRLDPSTGAVKTWRIPAPADNPAAESVRPSAVQGLYLVQAIDISPDGGQIAIAMDLSSSVELFDPSAGTFTQIAMPDTSDTPVSLAYATDGTLGVAIANYQTHIWDTAVVVRPGTTSAPKAIPVTHLTDHTILVGYGRVGNLIGNDLKQKKLPFLVIEASDGTVSKLRESGIEALTGNAAQPEILRAAALPKSRNVVVAIPEAFEAGQIVQQARAANANIRIIARAHSDAEVEHLQGLGADMVIMGEREIARGMIEELERSFPDAADEDSPRVAEAGSRL